MVLVAVPRLAFELVSVPLEVSVPTLQDVPLVVFVVPADVPPVPGDATNVIPEELPVLCPLGNVSDVIAAVSLLVVLDVGFAAGVGAVAEVADASLTGGSSGTIGVPPPFTLFGP